MQGAEQNKFLREIALEPRAVGYFLAESKQRRIFCFQITGKTMGPAASLPRAGATARNGISLNGTDRRHVKLTLA